MRRRNVILLAIALAVLGVMAAVGYLFGERRYCATP